MNSQPEQNIKMSENIILADADYVDATAFNLIVNFERMIGRPIPKADLSQWAVCMALDGGVKAGDNEVQVVLVHDEKSTSMTNFAPSSYADELHAKAFRDPYLGEFTITSIATDQHFSKDDYLEEVMKTLLHHPEVKRVMVVVNTEEGEAYERIKALLRKADDDDKRITLFSMEPLAGGNFRQEILGYSLMSALGIKAEEIK